MPERAAAARAGLAIALAYTLPLALWLGGQAVLSSAGRFDLAAPLRAMVTTALLLQCCGLALGLPRLMRFETPAERCCGVAMLVLVPAPLYAIASLSGAVSPTALVVALAALAAIALPVHGVYAACLRLTTAGQARSVLLLATRFLLVWLCWQYRHLWQQVASL